MATIIDLNDAKKQAEIDALLAKPFRLEADDVRLRVQVRMVDYLHWLYGNRIVIRGHNGRIGSPEGEPGGSCSIELRGDNAGIWMDFSDKSSGNLFDLYAIYMRLDRHRDFVRILTEISVGFLGQHVESARAWDGPSVGERIAANRARHGDMPCEATQQLGPAEMSWRYLDADGRIVGIVRRYALDAIDPDTGKLLKTYRPFFGGRVGAPRVRPLYRVPSILGAPEVVLVEGEKCADALVSIGVEATTVMMGANAPLDRVDWSPLRGKRVTIWPDHDTPGYAYAKRAAQILSGMGCEVWAVDPPPDKPAKWDVADMLEEGGDPAELLASARRWTSQEEPVREEPQKWPFELVKPSQLRLYVPGPMLVQGILPRHGITVMYGSPGARKSFAALDISLCVATGLDWHGHKVNDPGRVIYLAAEGKYGISARFLAWEKAKGIFVSDDQFRLILSEADFPSQIDQIIETVRRENFETRLFTTDTLASTFGSGDENTQKDMNKYMNAIKKLCSELETHTLLVHHCGKDGLKGARGSSVLLATCDAEFQLTKKGRTGPTTIKNTKQKDNPEAPDIKLVAVSIEIEQGDIIGSSSVLVLEEPILGGKDESVGENDDDESETEGIRLGRIDKAILDKLAELEEGIAGMSLVTLTSVVDRDKSNVRRSLLKLCECGLVIEVGDETMITKLYRLAQKINRG